MRLIASDYLLLTDSLDQFKQRYPDVCEEYSNFFQVEKAACERFPRFLERTYLCRKHLGGKIFKSTYISDEAKALLGFAGDNALQPMRDLGAHNHGSQRIPEFSFVTLAAAFERKYEGGRTLEFSEASEFLDLAKDVLSELVSSGRLKSADPNSERFDELDLYRFLVSVGGTPFTLIQHIALADDGSEVAEPIALLQGGTISRLLGQLAFEEDGHTEVRAIMRMGLATYQHVVLYPPSSGIQGRTSI